MPNDQKLPPPSGDSQRAESYVKQLADLISQNKLRVIHTDLSKFDPSSLHDHYSLDLNDYQVEISHSKQPTTGRDSYVVLFNNIKNLQEGETQKEILAYLVLSEEQFKKLKDVADEQIETLKKIEEEKRFQEKMNPVDQLLDKITKGEVDLSQPPQPVPAIPNEERRPDQGTEEKREAVEAPKEEKTAEAPPIPALETRGSEAAAQPTEPSSTDLPAIATPDTVLPNQTAESKPEASPAEPLSPLAQAAALPIPEKSPSPAPIVEEVDQNGAPAPITMPTEPAPTTPQSAENPLQNSEPPLSAPSQPAPETNFTSPTASIEPTSASPMPAGQPAPSIEEVQKALADAYAKSPPAPPPPGFRPGLGDIPQPATPAQSVATETPAQVSVAPSIDQAIDQAFKPSDNSVLTHGSQMPNV